MSYCMFCTVGHFAQELLLRVLAHILSRASCDGSCAIVSLKDKSLNLPPPQPAMAARIGEELREEGDGRIPREQQVEAKPINSPSSLRKVLAAGGGIRVGQDTASVSGYKRKHGVLTEEEESGVQKGLRCSDIPAAIQSSGAFLPQSTVESLKRRAKESSSTRRTPSHGEMITAEQLSAALSSVITRGVQGEDRGKEGGGGRESVTTSGPFTGTHDQNPVVSITSLVSNVKHSTNVELTKVRQNLPAEVRSPIQSTPPFVHHPNVMSHPSMTKPLSPKVTPQRRPSDPCALLHLNIG